MKNLITGLKSFLVVAIICGLLYPCVVTLAGQLAFREKANGSLLYAADDKEKVVGSELLGQTFTSAKYFHGRPQEVLNLPPNSPIMQQKLTQRAEAYGGELAAVPLDLITGSASGYDRFITLEAAKFQIPRIAQERHLSEAELTALITHYQEKNGWFGEGATLVPVVPLNLALDASTK